MTHILSKRLQCDLELLLNGGFAPLKGFLNKNDYESVVESMRLKTGELWPMPIVLPINDKIVETLNLGDTLTLCNEENLPLAYLEIESIYKPNLINECEKVFGSSDDNHPYVKIIMGYEDCHYVGGKVTKIQDIPHFDFGDIRMFPSETKKFFKDNKWDRVVGFQTRNPMHRSHYELTRYAMKKGEAKLFLNPVVGITQDCDIDYFTRVKCYKKLMGHYPKDSAILCLLPLSMRMAGPREAVWHALIRKNYGCTHFVVGRDHAGPSYKKKDGSDFYGPYEAQELLLSVADEIGINCILSKMIVYAINKDDDNDCKYASIDTINEEKYKVMKISGTQQREMLRTGVKLPEWFTFPEIEEELVKQFKSSYDKGLCLYFIGLSGSGKTTVVKALREKMREYTEKEISILDGDVIRQNLSKGLGFSKEDRSTNVRRIGYVASEIVKHGGIVFCSNIAPYEDDREFNRSLIGSLGHYIQVHVNTSLDECENRDVKGLYKLARKGVIKQFTGINDPFEIPLNNEITIDGSTNISLSDNIDTIISFLIEKNIIHNNK
jgi:sulfate adenylyltransferase